MGKIPAIDDGKVLVHRIGADRKLADPFADHPGPALGRMHTRSRGLIGRAHGIHQIPVKARPVAITPRRVEVFITQCILDLAVKLAAHRGFVNCRYGCVFAVRRGDLAGVKLPFGIKGLLDAAKHVIKLRPEINGGVFAPEPLAMLAPDQAVIAFGKRRHRVRNAADAGLVLFIHHVKQRADMQTPDIDMAKHAVIKPLGIKQGAKLGNEIGQVFRRHGGIFDKRCGAAFALKIAKQAHRFRPDRPDGGDLRRVGRLHKADGGKVGIRVGLKVGFKLRLLGRHLGLRLADELDDVKAACRRRAVFRAKKLAQHVPAFILLGQFHDLVIDAFNRHRVKLHQRFDVTKG